MIPIKLTTKTPSSSSFPSNSLKSPSAKKIRNKKKKKEIFWLLPENISFLQSHCTIPHFELNYAQTWPYFLDTNSRARNLFLLICGRGRSQEDTKIQSEKAETALHPKADARFLLTLSARSQEVLSTLHSPGQQESYQILMQLLPMPKICFSLKLMGERSATVHHVSCIVWFLICIHGTLPVIKGTDKIYTSHCLPFDPITFPLSFFFLNSPSFSLTLLILTKFLILSLLHHISPPRLELLEFHCHQQ